MLPNESRIIDCILSTVIAAGYCCSVVEGDYLEINRSTDITSIKEAITGEGETYLRVLKQDDPFHLGTVVLIFNNGNEGIDIIADTASCDHAAFDALLAPVYQLVDSLDSTE